MGLALTNHTEKMMQKEEKNGIVYFARHGRSLWNIEGRICGATDIELAPEGHRQAMALGEKIKAEGIPIHEILYSPLKRTAETARHISEITGIAAHPEARIIEQNFGKYEGLPIETPGFFEDKMRMFYDFETGETVATALARVYSLLEELKKEPEKVRLLVAHNGIARCFETYFRDMDLREFAGGVRFGNCELIKRAF